MASEIYAQERHREVTGGLVERIFGPSSPASRRLAFALRLTMNPIVAAWRPTPRGIKLARLAFDPGATVPPLRGTRFQRKVIHGVKVEWTTAKRAEAEADPHERVILYLHGGGFVVGSPRTHRNIVSRLSEITATPVASVEYSMAPEASIQASRADAAAVYKGLLESGYPPDSIVVMGDSAGGNLAMWVALIAIERGLGSPAALVLLSPWVDLRAGGGGRSRIANAKTEFFIGGDALERIARVLVPVHEERGHWPNSPITAPDRLLSKLPPVLIQVGGDEVLRDDGVQLGRRIGQAGGTAEVQIYDGQGHVVALWGTNPDARRAMREIAEWLHDKLPRDRAPAEPTTEQVKEVADAPHLIDRLR